MRYMVRKSVVDIIGTIWVPMGPIFAQHKELSSYDVDNMRGQDGKITRDSVEQWLMTNAGDFSSVKDFRASIEDGNETIDIDWQLGEESDCEYSDAMFSSEDD